MAVLIAELTRDEVLEAIKTYLGDVPFTLNSFQIKPASENPLGFLGEHLRITANITRNGKEEIKHMFAKQIPSKVQTHYDYAKNTRAFYKEIEIYKTLLQDILKAFDPNNKTTKWVPDFYYSRGEEVFVVEDLSVDGYYMVPERTCMDLDHMRLTMEAMAIMHAGSFIFEEKLNAGKAQTLSPKYKPGEKATIGDLYGHLLFETEASDDPSHPGNALWEAAFSSQLVLVDVLPDYTAEQRQAIKDNLVAEMRKVLQFVKPSDKFKNVLLHGDLWSNNLMFRKDADGSVSDAIILDFQLARYGPPAHDIVMCLYLCQTRKFRQEHESELLELYYTKLSSVLEAENLEVEKLFPRKEFEDSLEYYKEYGITNCISYFQLILTPSHIAAEFLASPELFEQNMKTDRSQLILTCFKEDEICRSRMIDSMREAAEFFKWA